MADVLGSLFRMAGHGGKSGRSSSGSGAGTVEDAANQIRELNTELANVSGTARTAQKDFTSTFETGLSAQLKASKQELTQWGQEFNGQMTVAQTALLSLRDTSQQAFASFAEGMALNIEHSVLYSQSIGEAMEKALKSTLAAVAGEAAVRAVFNTGLGFYYLAIQAYGQAAEAFEAAAVFGSVAALAGAVSQAIPGGTTAGARAEGPRGSASAAAASQAGSGAAASAGGGASQPGGNLTVMVVGEQQAATWLARVINNGVERYDLRLVASQSKRSAPAVR